MTVSFGKNRSAKVILKDSFRQFIDIFTYVVYLKTCISLLVSIAVRNISPWLIWISVNLPNVWKNGKKPSAELNVKTENPTLMYVRWIISTTTRLAEGAI